MTGYNPVGKKVDVDTRTGKLYESMETALQDGAKFEDLMMFVRSEAKQSQLESMLVRLDDGSELAEKAKQFKSAKEFNPLLGNRAQRRASAKKKKAISK
jgi:hypothetical protein